MNFRIYLFTLSPTDR